MLTGRDTAPDGAGLENALVFMEELKADGRWDYHSAQLAGEDGRFTFARVVPGTRVRLRVQPGDAYLEQWYGGGRDSVSATTLTLAAGATAIGDVSVQHAAMFTGRVVAPAYSDPLSGGVEAMFWDRTRWSTVAYGTPLVDGTFALGGLVPGMAYRLAFRNFGGVREVEYLGGVYDIENSPALVAALGETPLGDIQLAGHASVTGTLTSDGSTPVPGAYVYAHR